LCFKSSPGRRLLCLQTTAMSPIKLQLRTLVVVLMCQGWALGAPDPLELELSGLLQNISRITGYSISLGYVDATGRSFGLGAGTRQDGEAVTGRDTFLFGSGTKPFTATAILRLHETGRIKDLSAPAIQYIDKVLPGGSSLVDYLGQRSANVTIQDLLQMSSGVADFDVPGLDNAVLVNNSFSPIEMLEFIKTLNDTVCEADRSGVCQCRFQCEPGSCVSYSSSNYVLAGLVLAAATGGHTWSDFDSHNFIRTLGLETNKNLEGVLLDFPTRGVLSKSGLTVAGTSVQYGRMELFEQDASVLGFTCGNCIGSSWDVARFYYELLGPTPSLLSPKSVQAMQNWRLLNSGWAKGGLEYGTGLMIQNVAPTQSHRTLPMLNQSGTYIGHAGDTYAFQSANGFYPRYNASISVVVNEDTENPASIVACPVLEVVAAHFGEPEDFGCPVLPAVAHYYCGDSYGQKICIEYNTNSHANMTKQECDAQCK